MKKILFILILCFVLAGFGCAPDPARQYEDQYRDLNEEFISHYGIPLRAGEDVSPATVLAEESQDAFIRGDYPMAISKMEEAIKWLEDNGY